MNTYWLSNLQISKKIITQDLQYYLGPDSHVRPYTRQGEDGFLITTPGECLTDEQIDDICQKSYEYWEKQAAARSKKDAEKGEKPDKPLKRPLNQPILVARGVSSMDFGPRRLREQDDRSRGSTSRDDQRYDEIDRRRSQENRYDDPRRDEWRSGDRYR